MTTTPSLGFGPTARIKKRSQFSKIQDSGRKIYTTHLLLFAQPSANGESRLGITVTKKVDRRAVMRNLLKRRLREVFRQHRSQLKAALDIVALARREACLLTYEELEREFLTGLKRAGFIA